MQVLRRPKLTLLMATLALVAVIALPLAVSAAPLHSRQTASANTSHMHIDCSTRGTLCKDVANSDQVFGHYVGHDEPSTLFYSNKAGSGNRMRYELTLPKDPTPGPNGVPLPGQSFNFQLNGAFWFGMALCDTQSYPELLSTCPPDSDSNIVDPAISPNHVGTAFVELQFYPPGWVPWPTWAVAIGASGCDPTRWCAAVNIFSLSLNPVTNQTNNPACLAAAGEEYFNFAFLTKNGVSQGPASPLLSTLATFTPDLTKDLLMNSGDHLVVTLHDSPDGLVTDVKDQTTGAHGFMVASAANGFGQVLFDPNGSNCDPATHNIPYNFHPMYSTSSEKTRTTWAAGSGNISFTDEIGHFDYCNGAPVPVATFGAPCPAGNTEGIPGDNEPVDVETTCFAASQSTFYQVQGCTDTNDPGFDGVSYQPLWPDGNTNLHPTPIQFSSPLTGAGYNVQYNRTAFETDLPNIEIPCNGNTGAGCTLIPQTDDGQPAVFYPFYSIRNVEGQCVWQFGNHIPGNKNDFGQNAEYGTLLALTFTNTGGGPITAYVDFRQIYSKNPCPA